MNRKTNYIIICFCFLYFISCDRSQDDAAHSKLLQLDTILQVQLGAINDNSSNIRPEILSRSNHVFYGLQNAYSYQSEEKIIDSHIHLLENRYNPVESEEIVLKSKAWSRFIIVIGGLALLLAGIIMSYSSRLYNITLLQQENATLEKERSKADKRRLEVETMLLRQQTEAQQELLSHYTSFMEIYNSQMNQTRIMSKRIHSKDMKLAEEFDLMLKEGQNKFNELAEKMLTSEKMKELCDIDTNHILNTSDRLLLSMLAIGTSNEQIASMLNTSTNNLKSKKSYLKNKIINHSTTNNGFERFLKILTSK